MIAVGTTSGAARPTDDGRDPMTGLGPSAADVAAETGGAAFAIAIGNAPDGGNGEFESAIPIRR